MITSLLPAWLETRICLRLRQHGLNPVYLVQCLFLLFSLFLCVAYSCAVVDEKDHTTGAIHGECFYSEEFRQRKILSKKFDIYCKIFFRDVGNFFPHLCELVLRHQMRVSNYFVNSFYSVFLLFVKNFWLVTIADCPQLGQNDDSGCNRIAD